MQHLRGYALDRTGRDLVGFALASGVSNAALLAVYVSPERNAFVIFLDASRPDDTPVSYTIVDTDTTQVLWTATGTFGALPEHPEIVDGHYELTASSPGLDPVSTTFTVTGNPQGVLFSNDVLMIQEDVRSAPQSSFASAGTWQSATSGEANRAVFAIVSMLNSYLCATADLTCALGSAAMTRVPLPITGSNALSNVAMFYLAESQIPETAEALTVTAVDSGSAPTVVSTCAALLVDAVNVNQATPVGVYARALDLDPHPGTRDIDLVTTTNGSSVLVAGTPTVLGDIVFGFSRTGGDMTKLGASAAEAGFPSMAGGHTILPTAGADTYSVTWDPATGSRVTLAAIEVLSA